MRRIPFFAAASALVATSALVTPVAHAQPRTADPAERGIPMSAFPRFVRLADNVYGYEEIRQPGFTTVSLVVIGRDGVLIADGQGSPAATRTMLERVRTLTPLPVKWYVMGSDHGDHTAGNGELPPGVRYFVHPASRAQLVRDSVAGAAANPARRVVVPPTAMSGSRDSVDIGGETVHIVFFGRAHTGGDLSVLLPRPGIVFMSEAYLNRVFPAMRSAYPSEWVATIDRALSVPGDAHFIPGHGFIESRAVAREELVAFRDALVAVIAEVKRLHARGLPVDDAIEAATWGPYASWFLAAQQGPIAVRQIYRELNGELR